MRRARSAIAGLAVGLLTVTTVTGAVAPLRSVAADAPEPPSYRLGYTSHDHPVLAAALPGGPAGDVLGTAATEADQDADARGGALAWIGRQRPADRDEPAGDVFVRRVGGAVVRLTDDEARDRSPALSPDGRQVAFTSDRGGNEDIWVVDVPSGALHRITDHPAADSDPSWSPDGTRLVFSSTRDDPAGGLYTVAATGGPATRLTITGGAGTGAADTQPAWSPDGRRIAFTTTRFAPAAVPGGVQEADVATVPAVGGPATRATPAGRNASQPAWAPDGRRLAFVSTRDDPAGDVYTVDGMTVTAVAADPLRAERQPTWLGGRVVHTTVAVDETADVWSADARGGDRRDRTARPWRDERGPAYSADGLRLAYSAVQPDGGERIVVADADGRNPRVLAPPGTAALDDDSDPTWSPDGTKIAFARRFPTEAPPRILVARVADGALVGTVPVPGHLRGRGDMAPAWAPDGSAIALARAAAPAEPSLVEPHRVDRPALPGTPVTLTTSVLTPQIPARPDIVFFLDSTASMQNVIDELKTTIVNVVDRVRDVQPDARFALVAYGADARGEIEAGRYYRKLVDEAVDDGPLRAALSTLRAEGGGEEGWYNAIVQAFTGPDPQRVHLRPGGSPIAVLIGDASSRGTARFPGGGEPVTKAEVIERMTGDDVRATLVAVPVDGVGEDGLDFDLDGNGIGEATEIAEATGGRVTETSAANAVAAAVIAGITRTAVTVVPEVQHCDTGLSVTFDPAQARVESGTRATFTERLGVAPDATPGAVLHCTVLFDVRSPVDPETVTQEISVRVAVPGRPFVRVDDVTVTATGRDGARVTYEATALSPSGQPMAPPDCTPPSGSVFPIGTTVITCTATLPSGQRGTDTGTVTVLDPDQSGQRIWLARIASDTADEVTFSDQRDVSARVDEPCAAGHEDSAPAWAPDSTRLAFADSHRITSLCVVDRDGSHARTPATGVTGYVADPAWSPDGRLIAFALAESEEPATIVTVPSGGGPASPLVRTAGSADQPAFQVLPARDLTVTVTVGGLPGFVGGSALPVTYTVRNASDRPAVNAFLTPTLPAALAPPSTVDPRCAAAATVCRLGTLNPGDQTTVRVLLPARVALVSAAGGRVTATVGERAPISRTATAPLAVRRPTLTVSPPIGPPGFVTEAVGRGFPPTATVRLSWDPGITALPDTVRTGPDGGFRTQVLIMRKDVLGPRTLTATRVTGPTYAPVPADVPFLVVPRTLAPPLYDGRR
ncbi:VWA domain-containing protein [Rhizomonospora bruguierae]|uniref:VWA domain-containing protein n=1 Tax=Rhizomonospora bruguierae TaxID=1581705 RepID=UPI001BD13B5E|nr:VWA domain-containing protein [Micromonospora sp. NBRC 107566]